MQSKIILIGVQVENCFYRVFL